MDMKRPRPALGYQVELSDDGIVLLDPTGTKVVHGNRAGALIWRLCDGQHTVAEIARLLSAVYPESAREVQSDVREMLLRFAEYGAIIWA